MKPSFQNNVLFLFILFLVSNTEISALMAAKQGQEVINLSQATSADSIAQMESSTESMIVMGLELCDNEDKECFERRMMAEAHLDYIYTQHHRKP